MQLHHGKEIAQYLHVFLRAVLERLLVLFNLFPRLRPLLLQLLPCFLLGALGLLRQVACLPPCFFFFFFHFLLSLAVRLSADVAGDRYEEGSVILSEVGMRTEGQPAAPTGYSNKKIEIRILISITVRQKELQDRILP